MTSVAKAASGRRFEGHHIKVGDPLTLAGDHPAVILGQPLFMARVVHPLFADRVLKSGQNSKKIGGRITKGKWRGFPVFMLTLAERSTCPRSCLHWDTCMGNAMNWAQRFIHGPELERLLDRELEDLDRNHPAGFAVRVHVLGDFYSTDYVESWLRWLQRFPALHVFGFTAWAPDTPIGARIREIRDAHWDRFAIRTSNGRLGEACTVSVDKPSNPRGRQPDGSIYCPAQSGDSSSCAACALCWQTRTNITFALH